MKAFAFALLLWLLSAPAAATVRIGAIQPLSGEMAVYGAGFRQAIDLAVEEINAAGGIHGQQLEVVYQDNRSTAQGSILALQKLLAQEILPVVIGPASSANFLAICPIAERQEVVLVGAEAAASEISACGPHVFRIFPSDRQQGIALARLVEELGYMEVALTSIHNAWGEDLAEVFSAHYRGKITARSVHRAGRADYRSELLRLRHGQPAVVVNLTYLEEGATMLKQAEQLRFHPQWVMGSAAKSPKLIALAGRAAEGVIGTYPSFSRTSELYHHYQTAFARKYPGGQLPIFGEYNFDLVHLLAKALNAAPVMTAEAIRLALISSARGFVGITGDKTFDDHGEVRGGYGRWTIREGNIREE